MTEYWASRSPRERILILLAGVLIAALLLNLILIRPLRAAKAEAAASVALASRTLDAVSAAQPGSSSGTGPATLTVSGEELRSRLVDLATQRGLAVSRLQSNERGAIIIQFDQASAQVLFAWLEASERQLGAAPTEASVIAEASGTVRASFEFRGGAS